MSGKIKKYLVLKANFNCRLMFGEINKYLALKVDFNCKLMFCKINTYFTNLYSTRATNVGAWVVNCPSRWSLSLSCWSSVQQRDGYSNVVLKTRKWNSERSVMGIASLHILRFFRASDCLSWPLLSLQTPLSKWLIANNPTTCTHIFSWQTLCKSIRKNGIF